MNSTETDRLRSRISDFLTLHRAPIGEIARHSTRVFEALCFVIFARHYEDAGYRLRPENLLMGKFRFRCNTSGYPWNFSYFTVLSREPVDEEGVALFEIYHNQKVAGAWLEVEDEDDVPPMFAVDVAVIESGSLPKLPQGHKRTDERYWVDNDRLITFAEAKKLTAYPMLLAQFLGTVHEIKPEFLRIKGREMHQKFQEQKHPPPTLMTANHLTGGTKKVLQSFEERNLVIRVVEDVTGLPEEVLLDRLRGIDEDRTPEPDEESQETGGQEGVPF